MEPYVEASMDMIIVETNKNNWYVLNNQLIDFLKKRKTADIWFYFNLHFYPNTENDHSFA